MSITDILGFYEQLLTHNI